MKIENLDEELNKLTVGAFDYADEIKRLYDYVKNEEEAVNKKMSAVDLIREDLLHILEFEPLNAPGRSQVSTALHKASVKRREIKNRRDLLRRISNHLRPLENPLKTALPHVEKIFGRQAKAIEDSTYTLRYLKVSNVKNKSIHNVEDLPENKADSFYNRYKGRHHMDNANAFKEVVSK
ncbi:hypothetical protein EVJ32_04775 [Exiguobacterium sp. SH5S4]|uniref:hypothetical protein n=1 Tax=Exiguobacterium sp. SH5S4 TaxID=2510961 RepID=UPI00103FBCF6|nr:hypothetical protein [Exiguobacterium sp. SH5S4]TCI26691.1 hypothetical protein EVJ32_04775 [Exiguobacterium sp. SH5S4]